QTDESKTEIGTPKLAFETKKNGSAACSSRRQTLTTKRRASSNGSYADRTSTSETLQFRPNHSSTRRCDAVRLRNTSPSRTRPSFARRRHRSGSAQGLVAARRSRPEAFGRDRF